MSVSRAGGGDRIARLLANNGVGFLISCFIPDTRYLPSETPKVVALTVDDSIGHAAIKCFPLCIGRSVHLDLDGGVAPHILNRLLTY